MAIQIIISHLPALVSKQIKDKLKWEDLNLHSLRKRLLATAIRFHSLLYGVVGVQMRYSLQLPFTPLQRDDVTRRTENLSVWQMFVCYSPVLDKRQREVSSVTHTPRLPHVL